MKIFIVILLLILVNSFLYVCTNDQRPSQRQTIEELGWVQTNGDSIGRATFEHVSGKIFITLNPGGLGSAAQVKIVAPLWVYVEKFQKSINAEQFLWESDGGENRQSGFWPSSGQWEEVKGVTDNGFWEYVAMVQQFAEVCPHPLAAELKNFK